MNTGPSRKGSHDQAGLRPSRREAIAVVLVAIGAFLFGVFEFGLSQFSGAQTFTNHITFFLLINLNILLLIVFVFLVGRNVVKLVLERRRRILGSHLRTRLVVAFVGLSLFPAVLLFILATNFMDNSIEKWFDVQVERPLEGAHEVVRAYYQRGAEDASFYAREIARTVEAEGLLPLTGGNRLELFLEEARARNRLSFVSMYSLERERLASVFDPEVPHRTPPAPGAASLSMIRGGEPVAEVRPFQAGDLIRAVAPVYLDGELIGSVVVDEYVPQGITSRSAEIARSFREYKELKILKQPVKNTYLLTLSLITLVVVFAATWYGLSLAKQITGPIQKLAEGARNVAQGDWDVHIERTGGDEIGTLVDAFNQMTSDLKKSSTELEEGRRHMETILANIRGGVVSVSSSGAITTMNASAERLLGIETRRAEGRPAREVFSQPSLEPVLEMLQEVLDTGSIRSQRQVDVLHGEGPGTLLATAAPLQDPRNNADESSVGAVLFFEDITGILKVQRMEAWREVAQRIAHEIKNPLTPIQLSAQRLHKRFSDKVRDDVFEECTRTIVNEVEGLKSLVNEFSSFARLPKGTPTAEDLNELLEEAMILFREGHPAVHFDFYTDPALPLLRIDREGIRRAVVNILDNAVAACGNGTTDSPRVEVRTEYLRSLGLVRLEIADNGIGMSPEVKGRLFEPYFSTKKEGTGLGLAIVSAILADHRAFVRVRDNEPRGSRFVIEFPVGGDASTAGGREDSASRVTSA